MDLKEIGSSTRNWVNSAQDRDYWRALLNAALTLLFSISHVMIIITDNDVIFSDCVYYYDGILCFEVRGNHNRQHKVDFVNRD